MYKGRIRFDVPMLWVMGFLFTFTLGGMTGVLLSIPPADFIVHNSLFLVAHFHNTIIGGVVFGVMAALTFWWPKMFGFTLNKRLGQATFWCWLIGFWTAFMPLYILGFMGMTRRMSTIGTDHLEWGPYLHVAFIGALIIGTGILLTIVNIAWSFIQHKKQNDPTGDPWNGRTLEWSIASPAPFYNFAKLPQITSVDQFWYDKQQNKAWPEYDTYEKIHMPKNRMLGILLTGLLFIVGFSMIWYIWWLAFLALLATIAVFVISSFRTDHDYYVQPETIEALEKEHLRAVRQYQALGEH